MKKVKWQWDWGCYVPLCPYCGELAYQKDRCVFCEKEYKWSDKGKERAVTVGEYTVVQTSNKDIHVYKNGRMVMHSSCTKRKSKRALKSFVAFYEEMSEGSNDGKS